MKETVVKTAEALEKEIQGVREHLHRHPELSHKEAETSRFVADFLRATGLEVSTGVGGHGVVGVLRGGAHGHGRVFGVRADMDALPVEDRKTVPYASRVPGVCHACGHDVHMSVALGTAKLLTELRDRWAGTVKFLFQPAEESPEGGAEDMIVDGALDYPTPEAMVACHVFPYYMHGSIAVRYGVMTAAARNFAVTVLGRGGHASRPHEAKDAIWVAAQVVSALHTIISRAHNPFDTAVIAIGAIRGGSAPNVIADRVEIEGTVRTVTEEAQQAIARQIEDVVRGVTGAFGAEYKTRFDRIFPPVDCDAGVTALVEEAGREILGVERVQRIESVVMGADDFSFFARKVPSCYFRLGAQTPNQAAIHPLHHHLFDVGKHTLLTGIKVMSWSALKFLAGPSPEAAGRPAA